MVRGESHTAKKGATLKSHELNGADPLTSGYFPKRKPLGLSLLREQSNHQMRDVVPAVPFSANAEVSRVSFWGLQPIGFPFAFIQN